MPACLVTVGSMTSRPSSMEQPVGNLGQGGLLCSGVRGKWGEKQREAYPSPQSLHAVPVLSFCIDREETKQLHWGGGRWGEGQSREGGKKENLGTGDYRLGESGPGWLALGALGSRARLTLMVSDQTDRVGARPGRPFTLAVALWWPGPLSTVAMDPASRQLWPSANLVKQACSCFPG